MLQLLEVKLREAIVEIHNDHFYNYEAGLQSLLVKNLLQVNECKVAFESRLTNNRKADIIILKEGQLAAIELKFFCEYRQMGNNEAAAMLMDIIIAKDHLNESIRRGKKHFMLNDEPARISKSYAIAVIQNMANAFHTRFNNEHASLSDILIELLNDIDFGAIANQQYRIDVADLTFNENFTNRGYVEGYSYYLVEFRNI